MFSEIPFKVRQQLYLSGEPAVRGSIMLKGEQREHLWVLNSNAEGPENLVRLYFIWSGSVPKSNETTEEAKDMLCVDTYPLWHLNFLSSSTHHEMWASEMRYTHIWILDYAVIAKCYVDAADEKNLHPIHGNIHYDWNEFVFLQNVISNRPEIFSFLCPSGDCHLHPCIFIRRGNNSFHMLREWKLPHRPFLTHVADHTFSLGDRVSHSGVNFMFCNGMSREEFFEVVWKWSQIKKKYEFSCLHHGLFLFHGCSSKFSWQLPALHPDQHFTSALLLLEPCDQSLPLSLRSPHETSKNCSQIMGEGNQSCVNSATNLQKCLNTPDLWFQFT